MATVQEILGLTFSTIGEQVAAHAAASPEHPALVQGARRLSYAQLDALVDRLAASLQRAGVGPGDAVAICAASSIEYVATFLGSLRVGAAAAPLAPGATPASIAAMLDDCRARLVFVDRAAAEALAPHVQASLIGFDGPAERVLDYASWLAPEGARPEPVVIAPERAFNIIYSSGTTGVPKGIVQSHRMRWEHVRGIGQLGFGPDTITLVSTGLYSNTTLVMLLPTLALGGCAVLMAKFEARAFLELAARERVTHVMLVPVQYRRLLDVPDFDRHDLSSFRMKVCTSAPFSAELKKRVLARWPGMLVEIYGMTEGGGTCLLIADLYPDKLHTVGQPVPGCDIRLIDEAGNEVPVGQVGEVVGSSTAVMSGYYNRPDTTSSALWRDATGKPFIRTGDVGRFDQQGFLTLLDRKKDMIISGGFNIYPSDLEHVLEAHPAVADVAVVGVPSERWGETPVAFVVLAPEQQVEGKELLAFVNERVGKTQRVHDLRVVSSLPRSSIGKVLKRQLREEYGAV